MSLPWMPLYVADYLADTRRLTTIQHGAYLLLIMEYWQHGALPDDDAELATITGLTAEDWRHNRPALMRLFGPKWTHKRIDTEREKAAAMHERFRGRAQKAARARHSKPPTSMLDDSLEDATSRPQASLEGVHSHSQPQEYNIPVPVSDSFPRDGSIAFTHWAEKARRLGRNIDVDLLASAFRKFCHERDIPFDAPHIARSWETFCAKHKLLAVA